MSMPLLATKFHIQSVRREIVRRRSLVDRLNAGLNRNLTLVSAPAGFGKSTLVGEWVQGLHESAPEGPTGVAWLSLDENDDDYVRFLTYFIGALQSTEIGTTSESLGDESIELLAMPQAASPEMILTPLVNQIAALPGRTLFVFDDYHFIENEVIHGALTFLVEHLPASMHIVIVTRQDPPLPLARLRARNEMTEIRAADLRFSLSETAKFMSHTMGLELSDAEISTLATRTEGWAAGLQLAGVSLQSAGDVSAAITSFAGSHRHITDYLLHEVLSRQTQQTQEFLLQTSMLDRLTGPLCDAVMQRTDGQQMIETLEQANLFIVPLDDDRRWYRYHHLFADLLQQKLRQTYPEQIPKLHLRASEWFEQRDLWSAAIRHAFAASDFGRAAALAELAWPEWNSGPASLTWLGWAKDLPEEMVRTRPVLSAALAFAYLNAGRLEEAEARLIDAERWMEPPTADSDTAALGEMVVADEKQFRALPAWLASVRAYHAQAVGDAHSAARHIQRALDLLPEDDHYNRSSATALLGLAHWSSGDLEAAHRTFSGGIYQNDHDRIIGAFVLVDMKMTLGHLQDAVSTCEHALLLAAEYDPASPRGTEDVYTAMSELHRERGDLEAAARDLETARELGEQIELPDWRHRWCIARARLNVTLGDLDGAVRLLDEAERVFVRTPLPVVRPVTAMKTRVWIRQGRVTEALEWARDRGLSVADDLSFLREFEHITLARALIARGVAQVDDSVEDAMGLLERLLKAAEAGGRVASVIEILVLQALASQAGERTDEALLTLERALGLAEPEGSVRVFVDEGPQIARLLYEVATHGVAQEFATRLLAAFPKADVDHTTPGGAQEPQPGLLEHLSKREIEVLHLIADGLSNQDVGARLFISAHTVKAHIRNIYAKLDAHNRVEAVARGRAFGLLPSG